MIQATVELKKACDKYCEVQQQPGGGRIGLTEECRWKWKTGGGRMLPLLEGRKKGVYGCCHISGQKKKIIRIEILRHLRYKDDP